MDRACSFFLAFFVGTFLLRCSAAQRLVDIGVYHNHAMMTSSLELLCEKYPDMTHLYKIGESVEGRPLWVIAISGSSPDRHVTLRPEVKYVGNIHGNEVVGGEILLHFAEYLLTNYSVNDDVTLLLDNTRIHIMPSMNPDGVETSVEGECYGLRGRANANGYDLNRNFPDYFEDTGVPIQKETRAVMDWLKTEHFVLSANFHGGALVATYPLDNLDQAKKHLYFSLLGDAAPYSACSDDDVVRFLAATYSKFHRRMGIFRETTRYMNYTPEWGFKDGISNGADWYTLTGGMQDYNYFAAGCFEITIELGSCKHPERQMLSEFWEENRFSLFAFLAQVHRGIKGIVTTKNDSSPIQGASVRVHDRNQPQKTTELGEFWLVLLPGSYTIEISKPGFQTKLISVEVHPKLYNTTRLDVQLSTCCITKASMLLITLCLQLLTGLQ